MMFEVAIGTAAGVLLVGSIAGLRHAHHWTRVAALGTLLIVIGAGAKLLEIISNPATGNPVIPSFAAVFIALGGTAYTFHTKSSPFTLFLAGIMLAYAALAPASAAGTLTGIANVSIAGASASALPALAESLRAWRASARRARGVPVTWLAISIALILNAGQALLSRGSWIATTPSSAWLLAAWVAASGGVLAKPGRPRAVMLVTAAIAIAGSALSL